jgi:hypothetical protein
VEAVGSSHDHVGQEKRRCGGYYERDGVLQAHIPRQLEDCIRERHVRLRCAQVLEGNHEEDGAVLGRPVQVQPVCRMSAVEHVPRQRIARQGCAGYVAGVLGKYLHRPQEGEDRDHAHTERKRLKRQVCHIRDAYGAAREGQRFHVWRAGACVRELQGAEHGEHKRKEAELLPRGGCDEHTWRQRFLQGSHKR